MAQTSRDQRAVLKDFRFSRSAIDLFNNRSEGAIPGLVAQSFSKNCGLYGQRVGCLHVLCASSEQKVGILSQLKALTRCEISTPPAFGARLVRFFIHPFSPRGFL